MVKSQMKPEEDNKINEDLYKYNRKQSEANHRSQAQIQSLRFKAQSTNRKHQESLPSL